jgi:uncharacterized protein YoxC
VTSAILDLDLPPDHPLRQILDTIAAHPEVREPLLRALLTEDFLGLPAQVQELSGRLDGLTGQVEDLRSDFKDFREETRDQFHGVNQRIDETNRSMQDQFQQVNQHIDETNRSMQDQFQQVNQHIDETNRSMQDQFQQVNQRIDESAESLVRRMEGSLGRFRGETYEKRCAEKIDAILVDHFGHAEVVDRAAINRQLAQARQDGVLSRQEYLDGRNADIIAHDTLADGTEQLWAVVEVSITFNRNDLENAARRAAIIAHVFGVQTEAFVATNGPWQDEVNSIAKQLGVTIIRNEDPAYVAEPL